MIRVMMSEFFGSRAIWSGTERLRRISAPLAVFYMFTDRERIFDVVEAICGGRMHPNWFRIGGVSQDLPAGGTDGPRFLDYFPPRLAEYDKMVMRNRISKRARGRRPPDAG